MDKIGKVSINNNNPGSYRLLLYDSLQAVKRSTIGRISRILRLQPNLLWQNIKSGK